MITLNSLFCDGAVFQQKKTIPVWGKGTPGKRMKAEFAGAEAYTKVSAAGDFMFRFPPMEAGGPFSLKITDLESGETVEVHDILVGEVWLASGQSNMEYQLGRNYDAADPNQEGPLLCEIQLKEYCETIPTPEKLRFFTVGKVASGLDETSLTGTWKYMTPENAPGASAVAAWFARFMQEKIDVPFGLIIAPWGGTIAEAWTSRAGLLSNPDTAHSVYATDEIYNDPEVWMRQANGPTPIAEEYVDPGNKGFEQGFADPELDDSDWIEMKVPGSWIAQKISGNGALWARRTVILPAGWAGKDLVLEMGGIDKQDVSYFNGVEIGGMGTGIDASFWNTARSYKIPGNLVKAGKNVIAVRAYSFMFDGAFLGLNKMYNIHPEGSDDKVMIFGMWKAKAELDLGVLSPAAALLGPNNPNTPGILFSGMIRPLIPYAIRGAIWYQGESNAKSVSESLSYEKKMETMIRDWRYQWGQGDFPFIQVQLANYSLAMDPPFVFDSRWAILRDAQRKVCDALPNVSMCTAVDVGDLLDIHPHDKKTVGKRMAADALYRYYGKKNEVPFGPLYRGYSLEGNALRLEFSYAEGMTVDTAQPQSFYVAGNDRIFHPATSVKVEDNTILVSCDRIPVPFAVRYGWSDAIISTVYNAAGFPASSFRTDDWDFYQ